LEGIAVPEKIVKLTKICVENSKAKVRIGKNNNETFPINYALKLKHSAEHNYQINKYWSENIQK